MIGISESARVNAVIVIIKVTIVIIVIAIGFSYIKPQNYTPFIPPNTGEFGEFGLSGMMRAAGGNFLRLHRLRRGFDGRAGGQEAASATCPSALSGRWSSAPFSTCCSRAC